MKQGTVYFGALTDIGESFETLTQPAKINPTARLGFLLEATSYSPHPAATKSLRQ
jgi:hypothetical protein